MEICRPRPCLPQADLQARERLLQETSLRVEEDARRVSEEREALRRGRARLEELVAAAKEQARDVEAQV